MKIRLKSIQLQKALVDAMAAKKKADAGGADGAKAEG